jgi:hypothetical protein
VPRDDAVLEDPAAAVGEVALLGKAIQRAADRFGSVSGRGRHVLGKVVAETPTGHEDRLRPRARATAASASIIGLTTGLTAKSAQLAARQPPGASASRQRA